MIQGSIVDLVTPLLADGSIDLEAIEALVDWHVVERSAALLIGGAPPPDADVEDRIELLKRASWQSDGRIRIVAAVGLATSPDAVALAKAAEELGAAGLLAEWPTAIAKGTRDDAAASLRKLARATSLPLVLRGPRGREPVVAVSEIAQLSRIPGIGGFVEDSADFQRVAELASTALPKDFALYAGHDATARRSILQGFRGALSVTANVAPRLVREVHAAAAAGDDAASEGLETRLHLLYEALMADAPSIPLKWALVEMGRINEGERPPKLPQSSDYSHLRRALRAASVLG